MARLTPVTCPNCHDDLRVEPKQPGGWVYCDRCARFFIARSSDDPPPPPWVEPVEIRCPNCVHQCVLGPEYLGRMVRCPHCDRRFRVVSPGDLISLDAVDPGPAPSRATTAEVSAPPRREETAAGEADRPGSAPAPPAAETAAAEARLREAEDQVVILRDQVRDLRTRLERADGAMKADEAEIQRLQQEIQAGAATSNQLAQDLERLRAEREELRGRVRDGARSGPGGVRGRLCRTRSPARGGASGPSPGRGERRRGRSPWPPGRGGRHAPRQAGPGPHRPGLRTDSGRPLPDRSGSRGTDPRRECRGP